MTKKEQPTIIASVTDFYLQSRDFNGLPLLTLKETFTLTERDLKHLIESGDVEVHFGYGHPNPHVRALPLGDKEAQLKMLAAVSADQLQYAVLYPTKKRLAEIVDPTDYANRPFTLMMALGTPSLEYQCFDPQVLKNYRDDPRYIYEYSGVVGRICITDESDEDDDFPEQDKVLLDCVGMGFNKDYKNNSKTCVVALPYHLHRLSPEHQLLWKHRQSDRTQYLAEHGFVASQIMGSWDFDTTMYEAFIAELAVINKMAVAIEGQPLFKHDFSDGSKPARNFHRLLMPTKREYYEFVESLDKLMSDNINRKFFEQRMSESVSDTEKGTIALLEEYFERFFTAKDRQPIVDMLKTFRNVRSQRSKSSHHNLPDEYSHTYNRKQRDLMREAYRDIRTIRLALTNAPDAKDVDVPDWLFKGEISPEPE